MRLLRVAKIACVALSLAAAAFAAVAVPGWRHYHAGDAGHSHSHGHHRHHGGHSHSHGRGHSHRHSHGHGHFHSHGHPHSHSHGHSHSHAHDAEPVREGWHVHVSILGFELTLWEPWAEAPAATEPDPPARRKAPKTDADGRPVRVVAGPDAVPWVSLLLIDPGPLPGRVRPPAEPPGSAFLAVTDARPVSRPDAPPVPPPEANG